MADPTMIRALFQGSSPASMDPAQWRLLQEAYNATPDSMGVARDVGALSDAGLRSIGGTVIPGYHPTPTYSGFTDWERQQAPATQDPTIMGVPLSEGLNTAMMTGGPMIGMIKAYHGSPYDFDAFDMSKIGTGEGAQSYGHGLYFAENPEVASQYRHKLSGDFAAANDATPESAAIRALDNANYDREGALQALGDQLNAVNKNIDALAKRGGDPRGVSERYYPNVKAMYENAIDLIKNGYAGRGKSYEVSIDAHPNEFLDWDKPLSEQSPKVQEALQKAGLPPVKAMLGGMRGKQFSDPAVQPHFTGADLVNELGAGGKSADTSEALRSAGIKGIRYADQGSRGKAGGTSNYVVFDDKTINILRKYGIAGLTAGLGGAAAMSGASPQPSVRDSIKQAMGL